MGAGRASATSRAGAGTGLETCGCDTGAAGGSERTVGRGGSATACALEIGEGATLTGAGAAATGALAPAGSLVAIAGAVVFEVGAGSAAALPAAGIAGGKGVLAIALASFALLAG